MLPASPPPTSVAAALPLLPNLSMPASTLGHRIWGRRHQRRVRVNGQGKARRGKKPRRWWRRPREPFCGEKLAKSVSSGRRRCERPGAPPRPHPAIPAPDPAGRAAAAEGARSRKLRDRGCSNGSGSAGEGDAMSCEVDTTTVHTSHQRHTSVVAAGSYIAALPRGPASVLKVEHCVVRPDAEEVRICHSAAASSGRPPSPPARSTTVAQWENRAAAGGGGAKFSGKFTELWPVKSSKLITDADGVMALPKQLWSVFKEHGDGEFLCEVGWDLGAGGGAHGEIVAAYEPWASGGT
ncbi:hypothetical protein ACP4OV_013311 [Aristida adscensionis]